MRRPEPSLAAGALFTVRSLLYAGLGDDAAALIPAFLMAPLTIFVGTPGTSGIATRNSSACGVRTPSDQPPSVTAEYGQARVVGLRPVDESFLWA